MMRAISLWEPWAQLMALEKKKDETRNGVTKVRGEVAICAALKWTKELQEIVIKEPFFSSLCDIDPTEKSAILQFNAATRLIQTIPLGVVVSVGELYDSITSEAWMLENIPLIEEPTAAAWREFKFGNYAPGRGVWRFRNMRRLAKPVPVRGGQQWFNLPPEVEAAVRAQL